MNFTRLSRTVLLLMIKNLIPVLLLLLLSVIGMQALFHPDLFTAHDIWHQVARFYHYTKAVSDGQFPPYWIATLAHGLGYPLFFFSYHLPWLLGLPLVFIGISIFDSLKILFFISYFSSGLFMYFFLYQVTKNRTSALMGSILYLWAPFRFRTILVSAAMGTSFVFVFLPLLICGIYQISQKYSKSGVIFISLGLAGSILSHLITFVSLIPLITLISLWSVLIQKNWFRKKVVLKMLILSFVIGIGLSAFYLLPAAYYHRYTQVSEDFSKIYEKNFVSLHQLIYSKWGYDIVKDTAKTASLSYQIGISQWLSFLGTIFLLLIYLFSKRNKFFQNFLVNFFSISKTHLYFCSFIVGIFCLNVLLMTDYSKLIWDTMTKLIIIDFPDTFLLSATFTSAMLSALLHSSLRKWGRLLFIVLLLITFYTNRNHLKVNSYTNYPLSLYIDSETTTNSFHEYLPKYTAVDFLGIDQNYTLLPKEVNISSIQKSTKELNFTANFTDRTKATVKHFAFPGVQLFVDNNSTKFESDDFGRISFMAEKGQHQIKVIFINTLIINTGKVLSLLSLLSFILLVQVKHHKGI